jgi:phosphoglycolate phosphatase-like HAD superfamily hydrolase
MNHSRDHLKFSVLVLYALLFVRESWAAEPLASWNDSDARDAIVSFVEKTTTPGSDDFVPVTERIAVFDNDGTLWSEQPLYFQAFYMFDRVRELAPEHPEWKTEEPFASILKNDVKGALAGGESALLKIAMATHASISTEEFAAEVTDWMQTARHPGTGKLFTEMIFQPMLEVLEFLRANGYQTFIVSGGGIDFMRPWTEAVYGIPPQQVVGSSGKAEYKVIDGKPTIMKMPDLGFIDDKEGKPVGIHQHIGRRPVMAFGNSDGDFQMLEWTTAGDGPRLGVLVHHTDAEREWAYDRDSHIGGLARGLDEGPDRGWVIVDMKDDWRRIYPE